MHRLRLTPRLGARGLGSAIALLAATPAVLPAQNRPALDSVAIANLGGELKGQPRARVRLANGSELEVLGPRLADDSLRFTGLRSLGPAPITRELQATGAIPLSALGRVQVRKSAVWKGALIGALVGGAALAAVNRAGSPPTWDHSETLFFGLLGGLGGSLLGAVAGAPFKEWGTVYQTPASGAR